MPSKLENETKFACAFCKKIYIRKSAYNNHLLTCKLSRFASDCGNNKSVNNNNFANADAKHANDEYVTSEFINSGYVNNANTSNTCFIIFLLALCQCCYYFQNWILVQILFSLLPSTPFPLLGCNGVDAVLAASLVLVCV